MAVWDRVIIGFDVSVVLHDMYALITIVMVKEVGLNYINSSQVS